MEWADYLGLFANTVYGSALMCEYEGQLACCQGADFATLQHVAGDEFRMGDGSIMFYGEPVRFRRDGGAAVTELQLGGQVFARTTDS